MPRLRKLSDLKGIFWTRENESNSDCRGEEEGHYKAHEDRRRSVKPAAAKKKAAEKAERKKKRREDIVGKTEGMEYVYEVSFGKGPLGIVLKPAK